MNPPQWREETAQLLETWAETFTDEDEEDGEPDAYMLLLALADKLRNRPEELSPKDHHEILFHLWQERQGHEDYTGD